MAVLLSLLTTGPKWQAAPHRTALGSRRMIMICRSPKFSTPFPRLRQPGIGIL